jgi:hypothetical protein
MSNDGLKLHIVALKHKHHHLELELNDRINHHGDESEIQELKKQKLKLKDEITSLENQISD